MQVLDCMHRFTWSSTSCSWMPCSSELVPFGCQHSIAAHSLIALLPSPKQPPQAKQADAPSLPPQQPGWRKAASTYAELVLDVCTCPGQVLVGWEGVEQEQQHSTQQDSVTQGPDIVYLLARLNGCHVPVTVLECRPQDAATSSQEEGSFPMQKQVR